MVDFKFNWDPSLELDIPLIDTQHQQFFRIGREIEQLLLIYCAGTTKKDLLNILYELRDFVTYHFFTEEEYMSSLNYPDIDAHKKNHQLFKNYINKIDYDRLCTSPQKALTEIKDELAKWVFNHMVHFDRAFGEFEKKHRTEA